MSKTQTALQRRLGRLSMLIDLLAQQYPNERRLIAAFRRELELVKESSVLEDVVELHRRLGRMSVLVDRSKKVMTEDADLMYAMAKEVEMTQEIATRLEIPKQEQPDTRERPPVTSRRPGRSRASSHTA